jgi:PAS domain S-box-containing protein
VRRTIQAEIAQAMQEPTYNQLKRRVRDLERAVSTGTGEDAALVASERRFKALIEQSAGGVTILDRTGKVVYDAVTAGTLLGFTPEEMLGKSVFALVHPEDRRQARTAFRRLLRMPGRPITMDLRLRTRKGPFCVLHVAATNRLHDAAIRGIVINSFNITDRKQAELALQEAKGRTESILNCFTDIYIAFDKELRFAALNANAEVHVGRRREDLIGKSLLRVFPGVKNGLVYPLYRKALSTQRPVHAEAVHSAIKGKWYDVHVYPSKDGIDVYFRDVTDRKRAETEQRQAEEALRQSELNYCATLNAMGDAIHMVDSDLRIVLVNETLNAWNRRLGLAGNVMGRTVCEAFPFLSKRVKREYQQVFGQGATLHTEESSRLDGQEIATETWKIPVCEDGKVVKVVTVIRDVTARKQAEAALSEGEARYRMMVEAVPMLAWRCDAAGLIIDTNRQWLDYTGQSPDEVRGTGWTKALHPDDQANALQQVNDGLARGCVLAEGRVRRAADGQYRWHLARALPLKDADGKTVAWFGCAADIEDQKRAAETLRQANAQLEQKVQERTSRLRALAADLTRAEHAERRRIAHLLHEDLQQRLVAVTYKVHELREAVRGASALRVADRTLQELTEAIALTRNLTTRLSPPVLYQLGLRPALEALVDEMRVHASLSVRITGLRAFRLPSDELRHFVFDAVRELLLNVTKHAGVKSAAIRIRPAGKKRISIAVCDKGRGMPRNHDQSQRFGLFSIRERAEAMGIGFDISSRPGKGTCVALTMPIL